ncbi:MAG: YkgJ family cysteine cluster protein [Cocleimonas sp.]|nr:YkgJ family cysteine cluster protein [Cocleimonas sp.]
MLEKIQRTFTSLLSVEEGREGDCNGCGDCCKLPNPCTFLKIDSQNNHTCGIYRFRPLNCRKFPRSPAQLETVKENCGFYFNTSKNMPKSAKIIPIKITNK